MLQFLQESEVVWAALLQRRARWAHGPVMSASGERTPPQMLQPLSDDPQRTDLCAYCMWRTIETLPRRWNLGIDVSYGLLSDASAALFTWGELQVFPLHD